MTPKDYETFRQDQRATDETKRVHLCPKHRQPMQMMYGGGWDNDRFVCGTPGCKEEIELETSSLPEEAG